MKIVNVIFYDLRKICRQKYKTDKLFLYLLEQSHPVHSPLQVQTASLYMSTVQDPSFRQGLGEQGLTEILKMLKND
jgi:hypothetical protein